MPAENRQGKNMLAGRIKDILIMKPKPSPYPLIRIGGDQDGAYLIPDDLQGISACFSPGVNNTKRFEDDLTTNHGIPCHLCDFTSDIEAFETPLIEGMQTFKKKWLDVDHGEDTITLDSWVEEKCSAEEDDLLLQMDIEGAEFRNLLGCKQTTLERFRIIAIELHNLDAANDPEEFELELGPLLRRLDKTHICVHAHPNNCCGEFAVEGSDLVVPRVIELTFLRRDRISQQQSCISFHALLPHPLDLQYNMPELPPLTLDGDWVDQKSYESESPASISTWKKLALISEKQKHAYQRIQQLSEENKALRYKQQSALSRIEYLENRLGELERPILIYLRIKRMLKRGKHTM